MEKESKKEEMQVENIVLAQHNQQQIEDPY